MKLYSNYQEILHYILNILLLSLITMFILEFIHLIYYITESYKRLDFVTFTICFVILSLIVGYILIDNFIFRRN